MQIKDYFNKILKIVTSNPFIESQNISFEERPPNGAFLTALITFLNGSRLHFKKFVVIEVESEGVSILKYGYNFLSADDELIFRYDNALDPDARNLPTYPHHKHLPTEIIPAKRPSLEEVFKEISDSITIEK